MSQIDNYYLNQEEPIRGCLLELRKIILSQDAGITQAWKYGMPFFCYGDKMFCYLWIHKKQCRPYIGIVEGKHFDHPELIQEKRSRMKIMLFDADADLPVKTIADILQQALRLYKERVRTK